MATLTAAVPAAFAAAVADTAQPMGKRVRAAFELRTLGGPPAVDALSVALRNKGDSALLRHELCYILGQMREAYALEVLTAILRDTEDDVMVRHEAAEAMGAIGDTSACAVLEEFKADPARPVAETCELALDLLRWRDQQQQQQQPQTEGNELDKNPYLSVDPAPADKTTKTHEQLREQLLDTSLPLFVRYRAMFSLRNRGDEEAVLTLCQGLNDESALFRHEIAYVLGQLQHPAATSALQASLAKPGEDRMVRHEAAEALGAIGTQAAEQVLDEFRDDAELVVQESCVVALDAMDYWSELQPQPTGELQ